MPICNSEIVGGLLNGKSIGYFQMRKLIFMFILIISCTGSLLRNDDYIDPFFNRNEVNG